MERIHKWNKEDTILNLYYVKYGLKGLSMKDEAELSECAIGASKASLTMQSSNIKYALGEEGNLTDFSSLQEETVNFYNKFPQEDLRQICLKILDKRDYVANRDKVMKIKKDKERKKAEEQKVELIQKQREDALRAKGLDPSRFKLKSSK